MTARTDSDQCKILFVDDDAQFRLFISRFLCKCGFIPLEAADATTALAMVKQSLPDLILCDLEMPGMDGYEFLATMHCDPATTAIPVIFLTGRSDPQLIRFGMNVGADDYLTKPFDPDDLFQTIRARLARTRQRLNAFAGPRLPASRSGPETTFLVKTSSEQRLVKISEITRIMAYGEYSWVFWEKSKGAMLRKALKQWLRELPQEQFVRVHRGAIVNLAFLDKVEKLPTGGTLIHLRDTREPIPVSLRLGPALNRRLRQFQVRQAARSPLRFSKGEQDSAPPSKNSQKL